MQSLILEVQKENPQASLDEFFRSLLEQGVVDSLLLPRETEEGAAVAHALIVRPSGVRATAVLAPVSPVNAAGLVSRLTFGEGAGGRTGVVLRPCEARALVELVKLRQASLESILIIGVDCPGTFETGCYRSMAREGLISQAAWLARAAREGCVPDDPAFRRACRICPEITTPHAALNIGWIGMDGGHLLLECADDLAQELKDKLGLTAGDGPPGRSALLKELKAARRAVRGETLSETGSSVNSHDAVLELLAGCRTCYNCRRACPICFCRQCVFSGETFDYMPEKYYQLAGKKGLIKMPPGALLFHLTRINHMGMSCVGCGHCESACPNEIPLTALFQFLGQKAGSIFDYVPGRDPAEKLPLSTYREVELEPK
ncbi:MAG: 4Fe-4S dicluster domain-containing protein [Eubacteriales bacterium]